MAPSTRLSSPWLRWSALLAAAWCAAPLPAWARVPELSPSPSCPTPLKACAARVFGPQPIEGDVALREDTGADADPLYEVQWGLENFGQLGGMIDADIDASLAWEITEGRPEVLVAVLDTGLDLTHPDIAPSLWINEIELHGEAGVDDDLNGCIDDVHGCWFSQGCGPDTPDCDPIPVGEVTDPHGHGTSVAAIVAGAARNGEGGRGVAPGVRLVPLQVSTAEGLFWDKPVVNALRYAAAIGADVINISAYFDGADLAAQGEALSEAVDAGALVVASAGNWGVDLDAHLDDLPFMPHASDDEGVVMVAAVDRYDTLISYAGWWGSDWGPTRVDLAGPSQSIVTARPGRGDDAYTYSFNGTSAAAPFVTGVAALVKSVAPELGPLELRSVLLQTVDGVASLNGRIASGGRVNANNAVRAATLAGAPPVARAGADVEVALGASVRFNGETSSDPDGGALVYRWYLDDGASLEGAKVSHRFLHQGVYNVTLEVEDEDGMTATDRVVVTVPLVWRDAGLTYASGHPYDASFTAWEIDVEGARYVRLHFKRLELKGEANAFVADDDAVAVVDFTGTPLWSRSEAGEGLWTPPLRTEGQPLQLWLDGSIGGAWGMEIDAVEYVDDEDLEAETGCGGCDGQEADPTPASVLSVLALLGWRRRRGGMSTKRSAGVA